MKKATSLLLLLTMVFSLATITACNSKPAEPVPAASTATGSKAADASEAPATAPAADSKKVAFIINCTTSQYASAYYKAFNDYTKNYPEVEWLVYDGQENPTVQAQQIDEAIANKADMIMFIPQDSKALVAAAKKAKEAGILVYIANNNLDSSGDAYVDAFLGPDYYNQGKLSADAMAEILPDGGKYVHLGCDPSYEAARLRLQGFQDQVNEKDYKLEMLGEPAKCDWKLELGKSNMTAFLAKYPGEIDAVYAVDDTIGNGGLQAIKEDKSGKNDQIQIVSIGGITAIMEEIKNGTNYAATIYQSPYIEAPAAIDLAVKMLNGEMPANKINSMDTPIITKVNVNDFEPAY